MSRIFFSLAIFAILLLITTVVLGLNIGDYNGEVIRLRAELASVEQPTNDEELAAAKERVDAAIGPMRQRSSVHRMVAILTAIVTLLVNSIAITYFVGTSRWCKEVVTAYAMDAAYPRKSNSIKRASFVWSLLGMLTTVGMIALGAASDPGTSLENTAEWVPFHLWAAFLGISLIAAAFVIQLLKIQDHSALVEEIMQKVREIRLEKGLEVE
ncbi:MAG: hypothetical protein KDB27_21220 [Planctomycetales bacterium]|nr:hypothetical protein [Planctomycetales bacterium]